MPAALRRTRRLLRPFHLAQPLAREAKPFTCTRSLASALLYREPSGEGSRESDGRIKRLTDGDYGPTVSFASSRKIVFASLTGGVIYVMQLMGIGGSTGESDWSDPVKGMPK